MWHSHTRGQRAFTLIELLAVMAILAILAAMIAPAVTGVKEASIDAKSLANAVQVRTASADFFKDRAEAEVRLPHTVRTTAKMPIADGVRIFIASPGADATGTQFVSSRWPELYTTIALGSTDASVLAVGAKYSDVFPAVLEASTTIDEINRVREIILIDTDGKTISGKTLLERFTAIDLDELVRLGFLSELPTDVEADSEGNFNFLWMFEKKSSTGGIDDDRSVVVFKLTQVNKIEDETVNLSSPFDAGEQRTELTYQRIF